MTILAYIKKYAVQIGFYLLLLTAFCAYSYIARMNIPEDTSSGIPGYIFDFFSSDFVFITCTLIPAAAMAMFYITEAENFSDNNYTFLYTMPCSRASSVLTRIMLIIAPACIATYFLMRPVYEVQEEKIIIIFHNPDYIVLFSVVNIFVFVFFALAVSCIVKSKIFSVLICCGSLALFMGFKTSSMEKYDLFEPLSSSRYTAQDLIDNRLFYLAVLAFFIAVFVLAHCFWCRKKLR